MFQLRCGYIMQPGLWSNPATANNGLCAGASVNVPLAKDDSKTGVTIDYSFQSASPMRGTHSIGASLRF